MGKSARDILGKFCVVEGGGVPLTDSAYDAMHLAWPEHSCSIVGEGRVEDMCRLGRAER